MKRGDIILDCKEDLSSLVETKQDNDDGYRLLTIKQNTSELLYPLLTIRLEIPSISFSTIIVNAPSLWFHRRKDANFGMRVAWNVKIYEKLAMREHMETREFYINQDKPFRINISKSKDEPHVIIIKLYMEEED